MSKQERAVKIVATLQKYGFEAYFVGGAVRAILMGLKPRDYDIVTSANPEKIEKIFPNHHRTGKQFGVMLVDFPEGNFEIATFRTEKGYADKRRPDQVEWTDARADVLRRDFTINALLYDPIRDKVLDFIDGARDLKLKLIRFVGNPHLRVNEDPVRILRAIRLKNELGFQYDQETYRAIVKHKKEIRHVAQERITHELNLMFGHASRQLALLDLDRTGLLKTLLPEVEALKGVPQPQNFHQEGDVFDHIIKAIGALPADAPAFLTWAVLLHDIAKPKLLSLINKDGEPQIVTYKHAQLGAQLAQKILQRLRLPRYEIETICWIIEHHLSLKKIEDMRPARRETYLLDPRFPWLLELHRADALGAIPQNLSLYHHNLKLYQQMKAVHEHAKKTTPPPLLNGYDLQRELGLEPGPKIGELLEQIRDAQLSGEISQRDEAIAWAKRLL